MDINDDLKTASLVEKYQGNFSSCLAIMGALWWHDIYSS